MAIKDLEKKINKRKKKTVTIGTSFVQQVSPTKMNKKGLNEMRTRKQNRVQDVDVLRKKVTL